MGSIVESGVVEGGVFWTEAGQRSPSALIATVVIAPESECTLEIPVRQTTQAELAVQSEITLPYIERSESTVSHLASSEATVLMTIAATPPSPTPTFTPISIAMSGTSVKIMYSTSDPLTTYSAYKLHEDEDWIQILENVTLKTLHTQYIPGPITQDVRYDWQPFGRDIEGNIRSGAVYEFIRTGAGTVEFYKE